MDSIVDVIKNFCTGGIEKYIVDEKEYPSETDEPPYVGLINDAQELVQIVEDLDYLRYENFASALVNAANNGVKIEYIYGPQKGNDKSSGLLDEYKKYINFYEMKERPQQHFIVVDKTDVGYENSHEPKELPKKADITYDTSVRGIKASEKFDKIKQQATPK